MYAGMKLPPWLAACMVLPATLLILVFHNSTSIVSSDYRFLADPVHVMLSRDGEYVNFSASRSKA